MRQPQVKERDIVNAALAVSAVTLRWQECDVAHEDEHLNALEAGAKRMLDLVKRFRKEQLR